MITNGLIDDTITKLLDEGLHPVTITAVITPLVAADTSPEFAGYAIKAMVDVETKRWLDWAEVSMANYAKDGSWQRLEALLVLYRKVTA